MSDRELGCRFEQYLSTRHLIGVFLDSFPGFLERIPCPDFALQIAADQFLGAPPKHKDLQQILIRIEPGPQPETGYGLALKDDRVDVGLWRFVGKTAATVTMLFSGSALSSCPVIAPATASKARWASY